MFIPSGADTRLSLIHILGIEIMLPDSKSANKAIARWRASSADIYRYLVKVLVEDAPDVKKGNKGETEATHEEK